MTASDIAAWWGAALASIVLAWDIYKWMTSGPRLVLNAKPNFQMVGDTSEKKHVFVEVVNRGDQLTTLTHLAFYNYKTIIHRILRRRHNHVVIIPMPSGQGLPFELDPGKRWVGVVEQDELFSHHKDGLIFAVIVHSGSNRDSICRVKRPA
jgi:hypothetical protein